VGDAAQHDDRQAMSSDAFVAFYRQHLPSVYGYLLHLCAGDRQRAEDLTQETFLALVAQLNAGNAACADVRWLITVARSKFLDWARRDRRLRAKLRLLGDQPVDDDTSPSADDVLDHLRALQPLHRLVLVMRYVDDLAVPDIAREIDREVSATYSLLARARAEMRRHAAEALT
jgi:RNA polymerase sigma-70 factor, ECF subfamily